MDSTREARNFKLNRDSSSQYDVANRGVFRSRITRICVDASVEQHHSFFSGDHCERQDYCASSPCRNGAECRSFEDSYKCTCAPGFTGPNCADDIDECERDPCKHGTCKNIHGSYR